MTTGTLHSEPPAQGPIDPLAEDVVVRRGGASRQKQHRSTMRSAGRGLMRASGPGAAVIYLSLLVLIPIAAVATQAFHGGIERVLVRCTRP